MSGLVAALAVFDDAALEALANKGLVRRAAKDVETGKVVVTTLDAAGAVVAADGDTVTIDAKGPKLAQCTCPAQGVCRHRLAAVIVLRGSAGPAAAEPIIAPATTQFAPAHFDAPPAEPPPSPALAEMLATELAHLARWTGKAAFRAAGELVQAATAPVIRTDGKALVVHLAETEPEVRILPGQGLDGIISKATAARRKALHAAAVLALRRANGLPLVEPASEHDAAAPLATPRREPESERDPTFHASVRRALEDGMRTALNQAPLALEDRLFELSVSSRADRLPRLSRLLRDIAAQLREKRARDIAHRPAALLSGLATAYALNDAIEKCTNGEAAAALAGEVRQDFEPAGTLTLDGLGAETWATRTGARGVTGYFYAHEISRILTATLARTSANDPSFDPEVAFHRDLLWGMAPLSTLARGRVTLASARLSRQGRLSLAGDTTAMVAAAASPVEEARGWPVTFGDWSQLEKILQKRFSARLSTQPETGPLLLAPTFHAKARFDEVAQEHTWPVADAQGRWIGLTLRHGTSQGASSAYVDEMTGARMIRLSAIGDVCLVLALPQIEAERVALRPVSVIAATPSEPRLKLHELRLQGKGLELPSPDMRAAFMAQLEKRRYGAVPLDLTCGRVPSATATRVVLVALADELLAVAEVGGRLLDEQRQRRIGALGNHLGRYGLIELGRAASAIGERVEPPAAMVLRAVHLVDRALALTRSLEWLSPVQR